MIIPYLLKNISFTINSNLIYDGEKFINYGDNSDELYFGLYNVLKQKFVNDYAICSEIIFENVFNEAYLLMGYHYSNDIKKYISFIGLRISILFFTCGNDVKKSMLYHILLVKMIITNTK